MINIGKDKGRICRIAAIQQAIISIRLFFKYIPQFVVFMNTGLSIAMELTHRFIIVAEIEKNIKRPKNTEVLTVIDTGSTQAGKTMYGIIQDMKKRYLY
jgi:hypothetical protein